MPILSLNKCELDKLIELNPKLSFKKGQIGTYVEMGDLPERGLSINNFILIIVGKIKISSKILPFCISKRNQSIVFLDYFKIILQNINVFFCTLKPTFCSKTSYICTIKKI